MKKYEPPVARVEEAAQRWTIPISNPILNIIELNGESCNVRALIDTGSPVSFIKLSAFRGFKRSDGQVERRRPKNYKTLSNQTIDIMESVRSNIRLELLKDVLLNIDLRSNEFEYDVVIGRDFLDNKLTLTFGLSSSVSEIDDIREFPHSDVYAVSDKIDLNECKIDFSSESKSELKRMIEEVNNLLIPPVDDDYAVRVNIRDPSIYAYAPRKFAHEERRQIRQITDDLLERDIIKPSVSPYCARIVLVRKKKW